MSEVWHKASRAACEIEGEGEEEGEEEEGTRLSLVLAINTDVRVNRAFSLGRFEFAEGSNTSDM